MESMALPPSHLQQTWNIVDANFRLVNRRFTPELQNPNAFPFKSLASEVKRAVSFSTAIHKALPFSVIDIPSSFLSPATVPSGVLFALSSVGCLL